MADVRKCYVYRENAIYKACNLTFKMQECSIYNRKDI